MQTKTPITYELIADLEELDAQQRARFLAYMRTRWGATETLKCETGYASEWANRFKRGIEYAASDLAGRAILDQL